MNRTERMLRALVYAALAFDADPSGQNRALLVQRAKDANAQLPEEDRVGYAPPIDGPLPGPLAPTATAEEKAAHARLMQQHARKREWERSRAEGHHAE